MPKIENLDIVEQLRKKNLKKSEQQSEDDLRVESGGPLGARQRKGDIVSIGSSRYNQEAKARGAKKRPEVKDIPATFMNPESGEELENPEEILIEGIARRAKKRKETKRYFSIGDRRRIQQDRYKLNRKIKKGEISQPVQVWSHPDLDVGNIDEKLKRIAIKQDRKKILGSKWPIIEEKKEPGAK